MCVRFLLLLLLLLLCMDLFSCTVSLSASLYDNQHSIIIQYTSPHPTTHPTPVLPPFQIALQFVSSHGETKGSRSPLLLAAAAGQTEKIGTLLAMGLDPSVADDEGNTMMHYAAIENKSDIIQKYYEKVSGCL